MAEKSRSDMLKQSKNPLLTGAGISFPFENFSNSALLVPVPLDSDLNNADGEGDSFLGQEEPPSPVQLNRPSSQPQPSSVSSILSQFTGFSLGSLTAREEQPSSNYNGSSTSNVNPPVNQPAFDSYNPFPSLFTQPQQHQPTFQPLDNQSDFSSFPKNNQPAQYYQATPLGIDNQQIQQSVPVGLDNRIDDQATGSGVELHSVPLLNPSDSPSLLSQPSETSYQPIPLHIQPPSSNNQTYQLFQPTPSVPPDQGAILPPLQPHLFRPVSPNNYRPHTDIVSSSSSPLPAVPLYSAPPLPVSPPQIGQHRSLVDNVAPSPSPLPTVPLDKPPLTSIPTQPAPPVAAAAPPKGGQSNLFRLGNLKRPTYAQPPDLTAFSPAASMATVPDPVLPPRSPASLFIPPPVRNEVNAPIRQAGDEAPMQNPTLQVTNTTDSVVGSALPSYQSPVPGDQASPPTVLPPTAVSASYGQTYRPPYHHWFYKKQMRSGLITDEVVIWQPMSMVDSLKLEEAFTSLDISPDTKVATDGGRYDVDVLRRQRCAVYWEEEPGEVRRCSWFVKGSLDSRYIPYEEKIATMLEEEYRIATTTNEWNRRISLAEGEEIILHSASAIAHHVRSSSPDAWGNPPQMQKNPRVVKRGLDEFNFPEDEPETADHLLFLVHGVGQFCDLKFRSVMEVVDDFRTVSLQLLQSHFRGATELGTVNRVEVLPVTWHKALHTEDIDRKLHNITLSSIHRLRQFTNDTLLDILFYTSPVFCETIVQAVGNELNRLFSLFKQRNPQFRGGVSLGGHSLGSLILFDMLCNQIPDQSPDKDQPSNSAEEEEAQGSSEEVNELGCLKSKAKLNRGVSYVTIGKSGTGQPYIRYPQLTFHPKNFFALGSPIGMFVTVRGIDALGEDFRLPTCPGFYNIFHPFDPVAYRVETLIRPELHDLQPVLIPHHKGRKRMHLELKDTMAHMGAALKQRLMDSVRTTWNTVYQMAMFHRTDTNEIEQEVNKVLEDQLIRQQAEAQSRVNGDDQEGLEITIGSLNRGRRIDYVLQEAPLESFNEYLFALSSHVCYWESEDTMLMILKEIYATMEITPDNQVLQQILPFEIGDRTDETAFAPQYLTAAAAISTPSRAIGMDPTAPPSDNPAIGPPPISGFVRK